VILQKFVRNIFIFCIAEILVLIFAMFIAVLRSLPGPVFTPLRIMAAVYTDLFRGVPTILVILLLGYGMPALDLQGIPESDYLWGILALTLVYSAYVAEVYRAGIQSVHPSQVAAARSLGLSRWQSMRHVVLPQAVRRVIPPLLNDFIGLQKDSALVFVLGVVDALGKAQIIQQGDFNFTPLVALSVIFIAITIPQARFVDWLIARDQRKRQSSATV
jgi:polar amino acid transport system permease protein